MNKFAFYLLLTFCFANRFSAQTIRINELSLGEQETMEYVEILIVGQPPSNCFSQTQCVDLRGWILDDNNGYFSGTGISPGAIRFANIPFWSCLSPGTLIVIYNPLVYNQSVIAYDPYEHEDDDCMLSIPVSSQYFEGHTSFPNSSSSAYATSGWSSNATWSLIALSNASDSFQIYEPGNTTVPVHAISWGDNNSNNIIYFSGNAGGLVFSAYNTVSQDLSLQANWAGASAPDNQTSGMPNAPENAALVWGMNNHCTIPLIITTATVDETCQGSCNGSATVSIQGGHEPYQTPVWSDGTTDSGVSSLCAGNYTVEVTDNNGCTATESFTISLGNAFNITASDDVTICPGQSVTISASGAVSYNWDNGLGAGSSFNVSPAITTTYTVTGTSGGCTGTASLTVTVNNALLPEITGLSDTAVCEGDFPVLLVPAVSGATSVLWSSGATTISTTVGAAGQITLQATNVCGTVSATAMVTQIELPEISLIASIDTCLQAGESIVLSPLLENVSAITWSDGTSANSLQVSETGTYIASGSNACGTDVASCVVVIGEFPDLYLPETLTLDTCFDVGAGFLYTAQGNSGIYQWNSGSQSATELITQEGLYICNLTNQCGTATDSMLVNLLADLDLFIPKDSLQMCKQQITVNLLQIETNYDYQIFAPWTALPISSDINQSGWYKVRAFNSCGEIWDSVYVDLQDEQTLYMPNTFTPNNDGINDLLEFTSVNVTITDFRIFNRWGEEIYSQKNPVIPWNGSYKGKPCPDGLYLVKIRYENCLGIPSEFKGYANLLR